MRITHRFARAAVAGALLALTLPGLAGAHVPLKIGNDTVALGWANEPTYTGELNAVQLLISDANGDPVTDLGATDLNVVVSAGGQDSDPLAFSPEFDTEEGTGTPGDYRAPIIPTIPGDYTFHLTGTLHGQPVDETATSAENTFASVADPSTVQFPAKVPPVSDLATRIDRVDSRATADANTALYVGGGLGAAGIVLGLVGIALALRSHRRVDA
jgi:hypothetical protein